MKGVPARTTRVVTIGGVLSRGEMDIVMNPHDKKALGAADYVKRCVGGKVIALSMGPDSKLSPIMENLYQAEVAGIDESVILSDRQMAGGDTLATAYTISRGIKKILDIHVAAIDELLLVLHDPNLCLAKASSLSQANLIPNHIFSDLVSVKNTIIGEYSIGAISKKDAEKSLQQLKRSIFQFIVLAGVKTTDGETGSVGPQVAEALSEILHQSVPHATYVHDFQILPGHDGLTIEHRIASSIRTIQAVFPALLTVASEYRSGIPATTELKRVRKNNYPGKVLKPAVWDAKMIDADPACLGLAGSPTWVGAGYDVGGPPSQRYIASTKIIIADLDAVSIGEKAYGPFKKGQVANELDSSVLEYLENKQLVKAFDYRDLMNELFGDSNGGAGV